MGFHGQASEILSALAFLAAAAVIVAVVIVITQRFDRRSVRSGDAAADERLAQPDEVDATRHGARTACDAVATDRETATRLLVVDDRYTATSTPEPWREVASRDMSDVVGHPDAVSHAWTEWESDALVARFRVGFRLDELADDFDVQPCSIIEELARRAFGAVDPVADPQARRFGQLWTDAELRALHSAAQSGLKVSEIARQLGRDQLSTVFRLLESAAEARAGLSRETPWDEEEFEGARGDPSRIDAAHDDVREVALRG